MKPFTLDRLCASLFQELGAHGIHLNTKAFRSPPYFDPNNTFLLASSTPIERTYLFAHALECFYDDAIEWLNQLHSTNSPDWHLITIDPTTSPLDADDWYLASPSKPLALAYILSAMEASKAQPTRITADPDGDIHIEGSTGLFASICRMPFSNVSSQDEERATNAFNGLMVDSPTSEYAAAFDRINGLERRYVSVFPDAEKNRHRSWHITAKNLCTSLAGLIQEFTSESIPRHKIQEIAARSFGFESWNHLKGAEKARAHFLNGPYYVARFGNEGGLAESVSFYRDLPSAMAAFGCAMKSSGKQAFTRHARECLHSVNPKPSEHSRIPWLHEDADPIRFVSMRTITDYEDGYQEITNAILEGAVPVEQSIKEYLFVDYDVRRRILALNARQGIPESDHLFICGWAFWSKDRGASDGYFTGVRLTAIAQRFPFRESPQATLYKAGIVEVEPGQFWLTADWDKEPIDYLEGIDSAAAEQIETKFFAKENWRHVTLLRHTTSSPQ